MKAICVLYRTNRFEFDHTATFRFLSRTITPQRFASTASLRIQRDMVKTYPGGQRTSPDIRIVADKLGWMKAWHLIATKMTALLHFRLIVCSKLDARDPANTREDKEWYKPLLEMKRLRTLHLATFEVSQLFATLQTPENIRLESGLRELLFQDRPVDDNNVPKRQEFLTSHKQVLNVLAKRRPQPVGELVNLDKRMIGMVDLVGREPEQERDDEGSSI